jgi:hypothetical protein
VLVAHACNSSYSGGRDQEDHGLKPAQANSSQDLITKKPSQKRASGVAQGVGPEFKPQYHKKQKCRARRGYWRYQMKGLLCVKPDTALCQGLGIIIGYQLEKSILVSLI